jgi:hypothetical protein
MVQRLDRDRLVSTIEAVLHPKGKGFSSATIRQNTLLFCANCPDPVAAMRLVTAGTPSVSAEELVDRALAMPQRSVLELPASELHMDHPLRQMSLDPE